MIRTTILLPFCFCESLVHFHFIQQQWWLTWVDHQIWGLRMGTKHLMGTQLLWWGHGYSRSELRSVIEGGVGTASSRHNNSFTFNCPINNDFSNTYWGAEMQYHESQTLSLTIKSIDQETKLSTSKGDKGKTEDALSEQSRRWNWVEAGRASMKKQHLNWDLRDYVGLCPHVELVDIWTDKCFRRRKQHRQRARSKNRSSQLEPLTKPATSSHQMS